MKVCYFGSYDKNNFRNKVIMKGLRANGVKIVECYSELWGSTDDKLNKVRGSWLTPKFLWSFLSGYLKLVWQYLKVKGHDVVFVGYPGHFDIFLAKPLALLTRKPLVFDCYLSLYDTAVSDRGLISPSSLKAKFVHWVDKQACRLANTVLLDTIEQIAYFHREYGIERSKFRRVFVGAGDKHFRSLPPKRVSSPFEVLYFGGFTPLHGVDYVVLAAKELEKYPDVRFKFIGAGQLLDKIKTMVEDLNLGNITFVEKWLEPAELADQIACADVCLGIFGTTPKAYRVIPHKVFVSLAMKKAVITGDSPAAREVLVDKENCLLCRMGDAKSLAESILLLKKNKAPREKIARGGYDLFRQKFTCDVLGKQVKDILEENLKVH